MLVMLSAIFACTPETEKSAEIKNSETEIAGINEDEIKALIERYDELLSEAYMTNELKILKEILTVDHGARLDHRLSNIKKANRQMQSELKNIEIGEIQTLDDKTVTVTTQETWDIRHIDLETQKVLKEHKGYLYEINYEMVEQNDMWLINAVNVVSEKAPEKGGSEEK